MIENVLVIFGLQVLYKILRYLRDKTVFLWMLKEKFIIHFTKMCLYIGTGVCLFYENVTIYDGFLWFTNFLNYVNQIWHLDHKSSMDLKPLTWGHHLGTSRKLECQNYSAISTDWTCTAKLLDLHLSIVSHLRSPCPWIQDKVDLMNRGKASTPGPRFHDQGPQLQCGKFCLALFRTKNIYEDVISLTCW